MAGIEGHALWRLADVIKGVVPAAQQPDRATARLSFVDDEGVPWYRIDGSNIDTPCVGGQLSEVQPGEQVEVEIRGGMLYVIGNADSPSVGQTKVSETVKEALEPVHVRVTQAIEASAVSKAIASAAKAVADAIDQHFWTDTNGIHVTHATQEDWNTSHSGPNVLINSIGQLFRDGLNNLIAITTEQGARAISFFDGAGNTATNITAYFGADGITLGRSTESHAVLDYHSMQLIDKDGSEYFHVSDLRDTDGYYDQMRSYGMTETTPTTVFTLRVDDCNQVYSVVDDSTGTACSFTAVESGNDLILTITTATPTDDINVNVYCHGALSFGLPYAYTVGYRKPNSTIGIMSFAEGYHTVASGFGAHGEGGYNNGTLTFFGGEASGDASHAEGVETVANGFTAHAEGHSTVASGAKSHAEGSQTTAGAASSHAEGSSTIATGGGSNHAEGYRTTASGGAAHAEGYRTTASGDYSHAGGEGTTAASMWQRVIGKYNEVDGSGRFPLIIGNGTDENNLSNALTVDWSGNVDAAGRVTQAVDSTTATVGSAAASIGTNSIRRCGNIVTVTLANIQLASAIANNGYSGTIATVPAGYRPASNAYGACYAAGANLGGSYARITTAGVVAIRNQSGSSIAASTSVLPALSITYIID